MVLLQFFTLLLWLNNDDMLWMARRVFCGMAMDKEYNTFLHVLRSREEAFLC